MKLAVVFLFIATLATCSAVLGQARFVGTVSEVIDGQTAVIEMNGTKMTVRLQHIGTPGADQQLHSAVRDHLSKMVLGKVVDFKPVQISGKVAVGKMTLDGVDVNMQLIRDGAAWHEPVKSSGQLPAEAAEYENNQLLARQEKRGVWSVAGLKTPWQIEAEIDEQYRKDVEARRQSQPTLVGVSEFQTANRTDLPNAGSVSNRSKTTATINERDAWVSVFSRADKESTGIKTYQEPSGQFSSTYTSAIFVDLDLDGKHQKLECRAMYITYKQVNGAYGTIYLIGFRAVSEDYRFSMQRSRLTVVVDNQPISLGGPRGFRGQAVMGAIELMYYRVSKATLKRISNARTAELRIDKAKGMLSETAKDLFKQLAWITD